MEAVITVVGNDKVGILAQVCTACAEANVNVEEVTQRILRGTFAMIMLVDVSSCSMDFTAFAEKMKQKGWAWMCAAPGRKSMTPCTVFKEMERIC